MFSLVGGFNHLEKYESQWEGLSHIFWKKMFQTTNQIFLVGFYFYYLLFIILHFFGGYMWLP